MASLVGAAGATNAAATNVQAPPPAGRYNVSAPHSPALERLLAGTRSAPALAAPLITPYLKGIDVSSQQHAGGAQINWAQVAAAGYGFAFVKVTEGSYYVNPYYAADTAAAQRAGIVTAAYHFAIPNDSSARLQADLALNAAGDPNAFNAGGDPAAGGRTLPIMLDLEYDPYAGLDHTNECYGLSQSAMVAWISAFVAEIQRRTGQPPAIYTIAPWWATCTGGSAAFSADPLWVASPGGTSPTLPAGWSNWEYWQFTSAATVPGIVGHTDVSNFSAANPDAADPAMQSNATGSTVTLQPHALDALAGQPVTWSATGLPPGLAIDPPTGKITGTLPATAATYPVTLTATDAALNAQHLAFSWQVHGPVTAMPGKQHTTAGAAVNLQLHFQDGLAARCSLTFEEFGLPSGLSMSPCGRITGWPTHPGSYHVTITAVDSGGVAGGTYLDWTVAPPRIVGAGRVRLAIADKCLAVPAGITTRIWTCGTSAGQQWQVAQNGTIRVGGHCLAELSSTSTAPVLRACTNRFGQIWRLTRAGGIASAQSGLCLTDPGASSKDGTAVSLAFCAGTQRQAWTLPPAPLAVGLGRCIAGRARPVSLSLTRCGTSQQVGQAWTISPRGTISVPGGCLTMTSAAVGARVTLSACPSPSARSFPAQRWQPMPGPEPTPGRQPMPGPSGTGTFLVNQASGLCLTVPPQPASGSPLALGYCLAGYPSLTWRLG